MSMISNSFLSVFYGWRVVSAVTACMTVSYGVIMFYMFGVFLRPISTDLDVSISQVTAAFTIAHLCNLFAVPLGGRLVDKVGVMPVLKVCIVLFGLVLTGVNLVSEIWHLYLLFALLSVVGFGTGPMVYSKIISGWFERRRGLALGIGLMGIGLGAAIVPVAARYLIDMLEWRLAMTVIALTSILICLPLALFIIKPTAQSMGCLLDGLPEDKETSAEHTGEKIYSAGDEEKSFGNILLGRNFIALAIAFFFSGFVLPASMIHLIPLLEDNGLSTNDAVFMASVTALSILVGRGGAGIFLDWFNASIVTSIFWLMPLAGLFLITGSDSTLLLYLGVILFGLGLGAEFDFLAFFVGKCFDLKRFGTIYGLQFTIFGLGSGLGPLAIAFLKDMTGGYQLLPWLYFCAIVPACISIMMLSKLFRKSKSLA